MPAGRPPISETKIKRALALVDRGERPEDAARAVGVSPRTVRNRMAERAGGAPPPAEVADELSTIVIDADGDPLDIARQSLARAVSDLGKTPASSPRLNPAQANVRAWTKMVATFEKERAAKETPEQAEARRRREAGETRAKILKYVEQAEAEAAVKGVCVKCGQSVPPQ